MNEDEQLLNALAREARRRADRESPEQISDADAVLLERLAAGRLDAAGQEALRRRAQESAAMAAAVEACQPFGDDFLASLTDRIAGPPTGDAGDLAGTAPTRVGTANDPPSATPNERRGVAPARAAAAGEETAAAVVPLPRPRRAPGRWLPAALAAGLAIALVIPVLMQPPPALPDYALSVSGASATVRSADEAGVAAGDPDGPISMDSGNRLRIVLRPQTPVTGTVDGRAWWITAAGARRVDGLEVRISTNGAVLFEGVAGEDFPLGDGEARLVLAVIRPGHAPASDAVLEALSESDRAGDAHWQAWAVTLSR